MAFAGAFAKAMFHLAGSLVVFLACCSQQLQQVHARSIQVDGPPWPPGNRHYCLNLQHLDVSEGHLIPAFRSEHQKYSIKVDNQYVTELKFTITFNVSQYNLRHTPDLFLDGKEVKYDPLRLIHTVVPLNETIGMYDRNVLLRVQDPHRHKIAFVDMTRKFDYHFHIEQPAEYANVVKATNINVRVKDGKNAGKVIPSTPTFKPFPQHTQFEFNVSHSDRLLDVMVDCSEFATSRHVNGRPSNQPRGSYMEVSMAGLVKKQLTISCVYKDPKNGRETVLTYILTFLRDVDLSGTSVDLFMMPEHGFCLPRTIYDDRLKSIEGKQLEHKPDYTKGFVCMSNNPQFQILAKIELTSGHEGRNSVEVLLTDPKTRFVAVLKNYVPVRMRQLKERRNLTMRVSRGRDKKEFQVLLIWPEACQAARCPAHHAPKEVNDENMEGRLCLEEACTKADVPRCCEKLAACSSMQCPSAPAVQVNGWNCMGATCDPQGIDKKHCCDGFATCNEYVCPVHKILRPNASKVFCKTTMCTPKDTARCCEDAAPCTEFQNKFGCMKNGAKANMPPGAQKRHCADAVCGPADAEHCCGDVASCVGYECPGGWLLRQTPEALTCTGKVCKPDDAPRCCSKANPNNKPAIDEKGKVTNAFPDGSCDVQLADGQVVSKVPAWAIRNPSGKQTRAAGDDVSIRKAQDGSGFIPFMKAVQEQEGEIIKNLDDGSYRVKFVDGEVANVPEWSLAQSDHPGVKALLKPGTKVKAAVSEDGDFIQHGALGGFVRKIHDDGTMLVEFDNGELNNHVPPWALRGVDDDGHIFVHSGQMSENERIIADKLPDGQFRRVHHATGTVTSVNSDGTYTVHYLSGEKDSHVPKWDVRAVDSHGRTIPMENVKKGAVVEVNLGEISRSEASEADQQERPRTRYLFGFIEKANPDGTTYAVKFDEGISESHVPGWAIKKIDDDGVGRSQPEYKEGQRVEARLTLKNAGTLQTRGIGDIGIPTREKLAMYKANDCWPAAEQCREYVAPKKGTTPHAPHEIPPMPIYQAWRNPYKLKLCYYEPACSKVTPTPKGCNVGNNRPSKNCRYCGFDDYDACKKSYHCNIGDPKDWPKIQREWCCNAYNKGCKYECRWGKWWPDEARGWGPWWSTEKRDWCCKNQQIGCQKNKEALKIMFKYAESKERLHQIPPPKSLILQAMIAMIAPTASATVGVVIVALISRSTLRRLRRFWNLSDESQQVLVVLDGEPLLS